MKKKTGEMRADYKEY